MTLPAFIPELPEKSLWHSSFPSTHSAFSPGDPDLYIQDSAPIVEASGFYPQASGLITFGLIFSPYASGFTPGYSDLLIQVSALMVKASGFYPGASGKVTFVLTFSRYVSGFYLSLSGFYQADFGATPTKQTSHASNVIRKEMVKSRFYEWISKNPFPGFYKSPSDVLSPKHHSPNAKIIFRLLRMTPRCGYISPSV